ncbi:MAG: hypothetical protein Q8L60_14795 [Gammaproteobacteria bacterium]|nr:hypothetical protein [Gammaproteobacteria bacterium]MDP2142226.1 hypothetical protein [Gammaproteobacteria bacterium]MDP2347875.1 hypothetical protein [Gammaproteobacteria bacterium]
MKIRGLVYAVPVFCALSMHAPLSFAEDVLINYEYTLSPQIDFSKTSKGTLKVAAFTDKRAVANAREIAGFQAEEPVAGIVRNALVQAFTAGGALLVDDGQSLTLEGELTEVLVAEKEAGIEVTIRTHITLKQGARTAFDTVIFGRSTGVTLDEAVRATLDRLVNSLILDDYFIMEAI